MNPGNGTFSYLRNMLSTQADHMQRDRQANIGWDKCKELFSYHKIFEESPSYDSNETTSPTGSEIIEEIESTKFGFINLHCHGGVWGISVRADGYEEWHPNGIISMQNIPNKYRTWVQESKNGLDMLTNSEFPMVAYSMSCDLMPYDNMLLYVEKDEKNGDEYTIPSNLYNFGDSFTIGGLYGGPAFIGNTRVGYVTSSFDQEKVFLGLLNTDGCLGKIRANTQSLFTNNLHCRLTNNMLGCPEFKMWIKNPTNIEIEDSPIQQLNYHSIVCDDDIKAIGVSISTGKINKYTGNSNNGKQNITVPSENTVVTLVGDYRIPVRMPLKINDVSIKSNGYYYVKDITTNNLDSSSIITFDGAKVTFDADGIIDLKQKIVVDNGSDIIFKTSSRSNFKKIEIRNGSKVTVISDECTVGDESICEKGCELIIKKIL